MTEKLQGSAIVPEQRLGEIAVQGQQERSLFEVSEEELIAIIPSTADGQQTFKELFAVAKPQQASRGDAEQSTTAGSEEQVAAFGAQPQKQASRGDVRKGKNMFGKHIIRILRMGALYLASFDDPEEGIRAGRAILSEDYDQLLGDAYATRITPMAVPLRRLRLVSHQATTELHALAGNDETSITHRYTLLKALGNGAKKDQQNDDSREDYRELSTRTTLACLIAAESSDVQRHMAADVQAGTFDHHIAHDILWFLDSTEEVEGDLMKVRHLVTFLSSYLGNEQPDKSDFYRRMVGMLDTWPPAQRQVILDARQTLLDRLQANLTRAARAMKEDNLFGTDDPEEAFINSIDALEDELARRQGIDPDYKAQIMAYRARNSKRGRVTPRRQRKQKTADETQAAASSEKQCEPLKLVTCNLNDYSITQGVEGVIDEFVRTTSQGNVTLRNDLERILNFMARTDLPPEHRRGVKSINGAKVRFGIDDDPDKLWDFFELKPSEAAGLSTKSPIAKSLRVYFIKMEDNTLGIIGIKPRSEQDNFLRSIRVKTKQRG